LTEAEEKGAAMTSGMDAKWLVGPGFVIAGGITML
jgi:hypothetical protein